MDTSEIKKKFLDILFDVEEPQKTESVSKSPKVLNAKDILYNKSKPNEEILPKQSATFIDFDNIKDRPVNPIFTNENEEEEKHEYVFMSNVSPIFGLIDDKKEDDDKINYSAPVETKTSYSKQTSYLGTVLSPYYGYQNPSKIKEDKSFSNSLSNIIKKREEKPFPETIKEKKEEQEFSQVINQKPIVNDTLSNKIENNSYSNNDYEEYKEKTEEIDLFEDLFGDDE